MNRCRSNKANCTETLTFFVLNRSEQGLSTPKLEYQFTDLKTQYIQNFTGDCLTFLVVSVSSDSTLKVEFKLGLFYC